MKTIAVLGTGNLAHGIAADMKNNGHTVHLYAPAYLADRIEHVMQTRVIEADKCDGTFRAKVTLDKVTTDIGEAVRDADYIVMAAPGARHEEYARLLKGHTNSDQLIITYNACMASLLIKNILGDENCPSFADTSIPPFSARLLGPGRVRLYERHVTGVAFFPAAAGDRFFAELCREMYPYTMQYKDVLECALSLVNPTVHPGPCLCSLSSIERPHTTFYLYEHGFSPAGLKIDLLLNQERHAVEAVYGYKTHALEDFAGVSGRELTWEDLYAMGHGSHALTSICGPNDINYRYLTEDVGISLVCWSSLAKLVGIRTPVMDSLITLMGAAHQKNWFVEGRTADKLGLVGKTPAEIADYLKCGQFQS